MCIRDRVSYFHYLGCEIFQEEDRDVSNKMNKFQIICGTLTRTVKSLKDTQLKVYKVMAVVWFGMLGTKI